MSCGQERGTAVLARSSCTPLVRSLPPPSVPHPPATLPAGDAKYKADAAKYFSVLPDPKTQEVGSLKPLTAVMMAQARGAGGRRRHGTRLYAVLQQGGWAAFAARSCGNGSCLLHSPPVAAAGSGQWCVPHRRREVFQPIHQRRDPAHRLRPGYPLPLVGGCACMLAWALLHVPFVWGRRTSAPRTCSAS